MTVWSVIFTVVLLSDQFRFVRPDLINLHGLLWQQCRRRNYSKFLQALPVQKPPPKCQQTIYFGMSAQTVVLYAVKSTLLHSALKEYRSKE